MRKVIFHIPLKKIIISALLLGVGNSYAQLSSDTPMMDTFLTTIVPKVNLLSITHADTLEYARVIHSSPENESVFVNSSLTKLSIPTRDFGFLDYATPRDPMRIFRKRFFWGIAFAGTQAKMRMVLDPVFWQRTDSIQSIRPGGQLGGGFGGSVAMRIGRFWELKMLTMLQLHERTLDYTWQHTPGPNLKIETISLDIPLTIKYRSTMPNNTGMYLIGGVRWSHDFQSNEDVPIGDTKPLVAIKKNTYYYEMGAGFEFRLDFVDLSLEFKLSNGLNNALVRIPNSYYSGSLSAIYPRLFSISLMAQD